MSHFITKCECCAKVMNQCRCPSTDKIVYYGVCIKCKGPVWDAWSRQWPERRVTPSSSKENIHPEYDTWAQMADYLTTEVKDWEKQ